MGQVELNADESAVVFIPHRFLRRRNLFCGDERDSWPILIPKAELSPLISRIGAGERNDRVGKYLPGTNNP